MGINSPTYHPKALSLEYDFAVDGGAVGNITLRPSHGSLANELPNGAVVVGGFLDIETAMLSATGTAALNSEAAGDILAAAAQAALTVGMKDLIPDSTGSTAVKMTAARSVVLTIATAAFTAGKFRLVLFYV